MKILKLCLTLLVTQHLFAGQTYKAVKDTTVAPYRSIGRIGTGCTGTLVGPRHVLTAAHCVYSVFTDEFYDELEFIPGQNGKESPFGTMEWEDVVAPEEWTLYHDEDYDFAMIYLKREIGKKLGWMEIAVELLPQNVSVWIAGYPQDKPFGSLWKATCQLYKPSHPKWLDYPCETEGGTSGAGVIRMGTADGHGKLIGIHAVGDEHANSGIRITPRVHSILTEWLSR